MSGTFTIRFSAWKWVDIPIRLALSSQTFRKKRVIVTSYENAKTSVDSQTSQSFHGLEKPLNGIAKQMIHKSFRFC